MWSMAVLFFYVIQALQLYHVVFDLFHVNMKRNACIIKLVCTQLEGRGLLIDWWMNHAVFPVAVCLDVYTEIFYGLS